MQVKITKVGGEEEPPRPPPKLAVPAAAARPSRARRTLKTYPKGILKKTAKIQGVKDPAKPPPARRGIRKHTVRVLTEKGVEHRRKTIRGKIRKMKDTEVHAALQKAGVAHNPKTPAHIQREILEGGVESGMISLP